MLYILLFVALVGFAGLLRMYYLSGEINGWERGHSDGYKLGRKHGDEMRDLIEIQARLKLLKELFQSAHEGTFQTTFDNSEKRQNKKEIN